MMLHPDIDLSRWSKEEIRMLRLKAAMRGKTTNEYLRYLLEQDHPDPAPIKAYCLNCHQESEQIPKREEETIQFTICDEERSVKVTELPAFSCSKCGNTIVSVGLSAEVENIVEEIVSELINRPAARSIPKTISFEDLLNRGKLA